MAAERSATKLWHESTFENRGKQYREYQVTKMGCEFLAHKTTGKKGNLFTMKYMERFEEMENALRQVDSYMIDDPIKRATRWIEEQQERQRLETLTVNQAIQIEEMKPDAEFGKAIQESDGSVGSREMVNILAQGGVKIGRTTFFKELRDMGYLSGENGRGRNLPLPKGVATGWFEVRETIGAINGKDEKYCTTMFTGKGQKELLELFLTMPKYVKKVK